ncbi:MAG: YheU family protein [Gammaproteobacteria bacterium]|nr:YheU family protein [Gammaproteobacteria bacterium]
MNIPFQELAAETLTAIIEEFISREGTDYGVHETSLEKKVQQVMNQLKRGEIVVTFDPESQSCDLQVAVDH